MPNLRVPVVTDGYVLVCCRGTAKLIQVYAVGRKSAGFTHHAVIPQYAGYPYLRQTLGVMMQSGWEPSEECMGELMRHMADKVFKIQATIRCVSLEPIVMSTDDT